MKKISLMLAALATTMAFTSCDESKDDHPVLVPNDGVVVENFLNTPEMTNTSVAITDDNKGNTFHMTCSQPSYGYAASVAYTVEVSLTEDFEKYEALATQFYDCSEVNPSYAEVATAISNMLGIQSSDQLPTPYYDIYARLTANVEAVGSQVVPNTTYQSNVVKLTNASVQYLAIIIPDLPSVIYLRGEMNNWEAQPAWEFLTTDAAGVYAIECSISADVHFKVADANWAPINYGSNGTDIEFNKPYELDGPDGDPPHIIMPENFTGRIQLTVKGSTYTLLLEPSEPDTPDQPTGVFIRGDMNGWGADAAWEFMTSDYKNIWYVKNVTIAKDQTFKVADADWGATNLGAGEEPLEIGKAYTLVSGGGNIVCPDNFTGTVQYKVQGGKFLITLMPE